ncbi:MAG: enoyl-CoA hydratase-related protein [Spirochaetia bacterium]|nr:enoyl-CoA hydratase-related protein [Spirochaetia bacterium]
MSYKFIDYTIKEVELKSSRKEKFGLLKLSAPNLNTLSSGVLSELDAVLSEIEENKIRVFIITSKEGPFSVGADISEMSKLNPKEAEEFVSFGHSVFNKIENMGAISIAAVEKFAFGGGFELALACDIRIFSENTTVALPEATLGLIPGFGGTQRLARFAGIGFAKYMILTGSKIKAQEALEAEIAQKVCAPENLLQEAENMAAAILNNGGEAVKSAKELIGAYSEENINENFQKEIKAFGRLFETGQPQEGLRAFLEKRAPDFNS